MKTHYEILGVSQIATAAEIKKAFKKLALHYHPDRNPSRTAEQKFKAINDSYQILSNSTKRYYYDQTLHSDTVKEPPPPPKNKTSKAYAYNPSFADWKIGLIFFGAFVLLLAAVPLFSHIEIQRDFGVLHQAIQDADYRTAKKYFHQIHDKGGDLSRLYYYRAWLRFEESKDYKSALFYINKALNLENENTEYLMLLAKIYIEMPSNIYDIPSVLEPVLNREEEHPEANFYLGQYFLYKENYSEALKCFEYALTNPDLVFKTQIYYAIVLQNQRRYEESIGIFKYLETDIRGRAKPIDLVNLFYYTGRHYFIQKDTARACDYWKTAQNIIQFEDIGTEIKTFCR